MSTPSDAIALDAGELRAVARYAAACARPAVALFARLRPGDERVRDAVVTAQTFADGGERTKAVRDAAWAAQRAYQETRDAGQPAASAAARAGGAAASAVYLHPLARATQVWHILGPAAYTAHALEIDADGDPDVGATSLREARGLVSPVVLDVLSRYPLAPGGRGRAGELLRALDTTLRSLRATPRA